MLITKNMFRKYLRVEKTIDEFANILQNAGFLTKVVYIDNSIEAVRIDVPSTRPDCNSVIGIFRELESALGLQAIYCKKPEYEGTRTSSGIQVINKTGKSFNYAVKLINYNSCNTLGIEEEEALRANGLFTQEPMLNSLYYAAFFYGITIMMIPSGEFENEITFAISEEDIVHGERIIKPGAYIIEGKNKGFIWGIDSMLQLSDTEKSYYAIALDILPGELKPVLDQCNSMKYNPLYYYYIRKSVAYDVVSAVDNLCFEDTKGELCYSIQPSIQKAMDIDEQRVSEITGIDMPMGEIVSILKAYGYSFDSYGKKVSVPFWRDDVANIQDIAADIVRYLFVIGREELYAASKLENKEENYLSQYNYIRQLKYEMAALGFKEIITHPFISQKELDFICQCYDKDIQAAHLLNPVKKQENILMPSLLSNMKAAVDNCTGNLFEISKVKYLKKSSNQRVQFIEKDTLCFSKIEENNCIAGTLTVFNNVLRLLSNRNVYMKSTLLKNGCWIWKLFINDECCGLIYFRPLEHNKILTICEVDLQEIQKLSTDERDLDGFLHHNQYMRRQFSFDLPQSVTYKELIDMIYELDENGIVSTINLENASLLVGEENRNINYIVTILFNKCLKDDIKELNVKIAQRLQLMR